MAQAEKVRQRTNDGAPFLAVVPPKMLKMVPKIERMEGDAPDAQIVLAPQFQRVIQQLNVVPTLHAPLRIGVVSAVRGEGRTTVVRGLAMAIAQTTPLPVVILEADLDHPDMARIYGVGDVGLCEYIAGDCTFESIQQPTGAPDLTVVVAGDCRGKALEVLRSERLDELIAQLSERYAAVVVDVPPLAQVGEATRVISQLDKVVMVVAAASTQTKVARAALDLVPGDKVAGVILNRTRPAFGFLRRFGHRS